MEKIEETTLKQFSEDLSTKISENEVISKNLNEEFDTNRTFGEKLADKIASIGGSWGFIIGFILFLILWAGLNVTTLFFVPFDPYPFIFFEFVVVYGGSNTSTNYYDVSK